MESYDQPRQHIKKQSHDLANKGPSSQSYGFSSSHVIDARGGTIKKAECRRIDAFQLWCWKRLLRVPWTARRSNQSILKEGLGAGGEGDNRGWDGWMASPTRWTWVWVNSESWWWTGRLGVLQSMGLQRVGHDWATELNWTGKWDFKTFIEEYYMQLYDNEFENVGVIVFL